MFCALAFPSHEPLQCLGGYLWAPHQKATNHFNIMSMSDPREQHHRQLTHSATTARSTNCTTKMHAHYHCKSSRGHRRTLTRRTFSNTTEPQHGSSTVGSWNMPCVVFQCDNSETKPFRFRVFVGWALFVDIADLAGVTLSVANTDVFEHGFRSPLRCYAQTSLTLGTVSETQSRGRRALSAGRPMDVRRWCASRGIGKECCQRAENCSHRLTTQIGNRGPLNAIRHLLERKACRDTPLGCCQRRTQLRLFLPTRKWHCCVPFGGSHNAPGGTYLYRRVPNNVFLHGSRGAQVFSCSRATRQSHARTTVHDETSRHRTSSNAFDVTHHHADPRSCPGAALRWHLRQQ